MREKDSFRWDGGGMQALLPLQDSMFYLLLKPFKVLTYGFASNIGGLNLSRASGGAYTQRIRPSLAEGESEDRGIAGQLACAAEKRRTQGQLVSPALSRPLPLLLRSPATSMVLRVYRVFHRCLSMERSCVSRWSRTMPVKNDLWENRRLSGSVRCSIEKCMGWRP